MLRMSREWVAAQTSRRFQLFRTARLLYEAYLASHSFRFDRLTSEQMRAAAADDSLR